MYSTVLIITCKKIQSSIFIEALRAVREAWGKPFMLKKKKKKVFISCLKVTK